MLPYIHLSLITTVIMPVLPKMPFPRRARDVSFSVLDSLGPGFVDSDSEQEFLDRLFLQRKKDDVYVSSLVMHILVSKKVLEMIICSRWGLIILWNTMNPKLLRTGQWGLPRVEHLQPNACACIDLLGVSFSQSMLCYWIPSLIFCLLTFRVVGEKAKMDADFFV